MQTIFLMNNTSIFITNSYHAVTTTIQHRNWEVSVQHFMILFRHIKTGLFSINIYDIFQPFCLFFQFFVFFFTCCKFFIFTGHAIFNLFAALTRVRIINRESITCGSVPSSIYAVCLILSIDFVQIFTTRTCTGEYKSEVDVYEQVKTDRTINVVHNKNE